MLNKSGTLWILLLLLIGNSLGQKAESGWYYSQSIGFSWNPLGVLVDGTLARRFALYPSKEGMLWQSGKMEIALREEWTPTDNLFSIIYTLQPIAFFDVTFKAGFFSQFDELGYGCFRLDSPDGKYDHATRKKAGYGDALGYWLTINPSLKLKFKSIVMVNNFALNSIAIDGAGYYHEVRTNLVHKTSDLDMVNDLFLFYEINRSVMAGVRYRAIKVLKSDERSHLLCFAALLNLNRSKLKGTWLFINTGMYPVEPLYRGREYIAVLVGKEFPLGIRIVRNEE